MNTIAITGASSGLGWQLSVGLAAKGKKLLLFGRDEARLLELKALVESKGAFCQIVSAELLSREGIEEAISALKTFSPSLLIHSAGLGRYGHFSQVPVKASLDIMRLNVLAVMELTHAWINHIKEKIVYRPKVVFIASSAAFLPIPGMTAYAASKSCLLSFAEGLRFEEKGKIDVLTVCPGQFATNFQKRAAGKPLGEPSTEEARVVAEKIISSLHKTGVYTPFPWNWILPLRKLIPQKLLMSFLEKRLLAKMSPK